MASPTPHVLAVKTLYRKVLKLQLNWIVDRDLWRQAAVETRGKFDSNRSLRDAGAIATKMNETKKWLNDHWHPDPYNIPTQQGGTSFQRNCAPPVEVLTHDHGLPSAHGGADH